MITTKEGITEIYDNYQLLLAKTEKILKMIKIQDWVFDYGFLIDKLTTEGIVLSYERYDDSAECYEKFYYTMPWLYFQDDFEDNINEIIIKLREDQANKQKESELNELRKKELNVIRLDKISALKNSKKYLEIKKELEDLNDSLSRLNGI